MKSFRLHRFAGSGAGFWAVVVAWSITGLQSSSAQNIVRVYGGTPYSAAIFAQSEYLRSQGDLLVSAANARILNADAAEHEMRNSVQWVSTYFERRRLNREARAAENPSYLEKEEKRRESYRRVVNRAPQLLVQADLSDELNWMLRDLLAHTSYSMFMADNSQSLVNSPDNAPLSASDKHHIRLNEGKIAGGKTLVFRADTAEVLETRWPVGLRDERFDLVRGRFEQARDAALADLKKTHKLSRDCEKALMLAVDGLSDEFNAAFPRERYAGSPSVFLTYLSSKRYLQALALSTFRLIETQSESAYDGANRFNGNNIVELVQHMMNKGLEFAPPEPGDEGTYRMLFGALRAIYTQAVPDPPAK